MEKKSSIFIVDNRTFEVITVMAAGFHGEMAECYIYEIIRPNWKIFRKRWLDTKTFWIDDFPTIEDGVKLMLEQVIENENKDTGIQAKWDEFFKKNT